jgi:RNA polymerase sigma-70 factor (ECF subfamily)
MTDFELLSRYREGDVEALGALIERHRGALFGYAMRLTGNRYDADEVYQETWIRVIRKADRFREKNFAGWLMRIAHNAAIDRCRRQKPAEPLDREDASGRSPIERLEAKGPSPDGNVVAGELGERMRQAVAQLPLEQREVFTLRTEHDMPFREIARVQRVSINTALARMQYALKKLRTELKDERGGAAERTAGDA